MKLSRNSLRQFLFGSVPHFWNRTLQSRPAALAYHFYLVLALVLVAVVTYSLRLYYEILDPHEGSEFFDFTATTIAATSLAHPSCAIARGFHPFKWRGIGPWLANYLIFSQLFAAAAWVAGCAAVLCVILSLAFRHFRYVPRARFAKPTVLQTGAGIACKHLPWVIRKLLYSAVGFSIFALILVHGFHVCDTKLVEIGAPIGKIANCRRWVRECARDESLDGMHLDCALAENYEAFPMAPCTAEEGVLCAFPVRKGSFVTVEGGVCAGEHLDTTDGGPVPDCPICWSARRSGDSSLLAYRNGQQQSKTSPRRSQSWLELSVAPASPRSTTKSTKPPSSPLEAWPTEEQALTASYMRALRFYSQGSKLSIAVDRWAITLLATFVMYEAARELPGLVESPEGYFRRPSSWGSSSRRIFFFSGNAK